MKEICKQHTKWINIVLSLGISNYYAEDIVQEAYIRCIGKEINESYFYLTLRSLAFDLHRSQKRIKKVDIQDIKLTENNTQENEILKIVDNIYWFDKEIFYLYYDNKMSMREISRKTNISLRTICSTIKRVNELILKEYGER